MPLPLPTPTRRIPHAGEEVEAEPKAPTGALRILPRLQVRETGVAEGVEEDVAAETKEGKQAVRERMAQSTIQQTLPVPERIVEISAPT